MKKKARTDSTEELLDIIRGNGDEREQRAVASKSSSKRLVSGKIKKKAAPPKASGSFFPFGRKTVIGVDINADFIDVVKLTKQGGRSRVLGMERLSLSAAEFPGTPGFPRALARVMGRYYKGGSDCEVWALLRTSEVDVTPLVLPKISSRRLSLAVYWQLQKEKKFEDSEYVLDYREQGFLKENGVAKVDVVTCLAKQGDVQQLASYFSEAGIHLDGITVIPVALRSLYQAGWTPASDGVAANIHIDFNFTCITILSKGRILFSRTIKFGINSLIEDLLDTYNSSAGGDDLAMPSDAQNLGIEAMEIADGRAIIEAYISGSKAKRGVVGSQMSRKEIFAAISGSLDRVSRQAERTLDYFSQNYQKRCNRLHLSGIIFTNNKIADFLSNQLGLEGQLFDPLQEVGDGRMVKGLKLGSQAMWFNEAVALALSSMDSTLNLKHTYKQRAKNAAKIMASNLLALAALVLVALAVGSYLWGTSVVEDRSLTLKGLEAKLSQGASVDEIKLQLMAGKAGMRQARVRDVVSRYRSLALLTEISDLVPEGVRILSLEFDLGVDPILIEANEAKQEAKPDDAAPLREVLLDGIILADEREHETMLVRLMANLKSSLLFETVSVQKNDVEVFVPEGAVMHFVIKASLT